MSVHGIHIPWLAPTRFCRICCSLTPVSFILGRLSATFRNSSGLALRLSSFQGSFLVCSFADYIVN